MLTDERAATIAKGPRVSLAELESKIAEKLFITGDEIDHRIPETLTICIIVTHNGFCLIGKSAPVSAENFDAQLGRDFAYEDAIRQLWPMEGYLLREHLITSQDSPQPPLAPQPPKV